MVSARRKPAVLFLLAALLIVPEVSPQQLFTADSSDENTTTTTVKPTTTGTTSKETTTRKTTTVTTSTAAPKPTTTAIPPEKGRCVWFGECHSKNNLRQNCPYNGTAKPLVSKSATETISALCPTLVKPGEKNPRLCCDATQINTFATNMKIPRQFFQRCPSCFRNFAELWCQSTCSPIQSKFIVVNEIVNPPSSSSSKSGLEDELNESLYDGEWGFGDDEAKRRKKRDIVEAKSGNESKAYISKITYYVEDRFVNGMYNACRNVLFPGSNDKALSMVCGVSADQCTVDVWLKYLGTNALSPFTIEFMHTSSASMKLPTNQTVYPMNGTIVPCTKAVDASSDPCSCQDCVEACVWKPPYPAPDNRGCFVGEWDCLVFVSVLTFSGLTAVLLLMILLHYLISRPHAVKYAHPGEGKSPQKGQMRVSDDDASVCETVGAYVERKLENTFREWGKFCCRHPVLVLLGGLFVGVACSFGLYRVEFTTDPVKLWSAENSQARREKDFFDSHFGPFYRTEQVIIVPTNQTRFKHMNWETSQWGYWGPAFRLELLQEVLRLQLALESLRAVGADGEEVTLKDICYKPLAPDNENCTIQSVLNYFQNDLTNLLFTMKDEWDAPIYDWTYHLKSCLAAPAQVKDTTKAAVSCLGTYGGIVLPYVALGGYENLEYENATALILTFVVENSQDPAKIAKAEAWEKSFVEYLQRYSNPNMTIAYMAERSIQDEIKRESQSDIVTIAISYLFMFGYIAFALGQYHVHSNNLCYLLVNSKLMLGFAGVLIVILCVTSSIGLYALMGIPATMIILEVQPFLVLAVGVDNIFIFVQAYQRDKHARTENLEDRIGRISAEVIPSMLLTSTSECFCFFLGALSSMPAVRVFSLYAGLAIFFDFFFQLTCFLALFTLDIRRQEEGMIECCCVRLPPKQPDSDGYLFNIFKNYYTPFLMWKPTRVSVLVIFLGWLCSSVAVLNKVSIGLDKKLSMPEDSYVLRYFEALNEYLTVGPPVYFVVKGDYDYGNRALQNHICSLSGCDQDSLTGQIQQAAVWSNRSYIATPASSWLDDYLSWLQPGHGAYCCRRFSNETFCPSTVNSSDCKNCPIQYNHSRPLEENFYEYLDDFLIDNPGVKCSKGGHAAYGQALYMDKSPMSTFSNYSVGASYFMTYHTILKNDSQFIAALKNARSISENITRTLLADPDTPRDVEVFPYSVIYVFYEQYLTVVHDAVLQLIFSVAAIFIVTLLVMGLDPWSALMVVTTIVMILLNLMGLMYWWNITFNAVSLVNLVMAVGISVEFCSHIVRAFSISMERTRVERATESLATMGSSVLSGITLTKFGGIIVLAFSHSQIFQVFYFRMYLGIVIYGAAHGLIFLPVMLSFVGPSVNKRKLFLRQQSELLATTVHASGEALVTHANFDPDSEAPAEAPNAPMIYHTDA